MQIYVHRNNQQTGPYTEDEIKAQLAAGTVTLQDHVWWQGQANWLPLGQTSLVTGGATPIPGTPAAATFVPGAVLPTSKLAIWALVCGCASLICGLFASIPAIVLGHLALGSLKKNPGYQGRGLALAGLIIGYVMSALLIVFLCFYLAMLPTILKAIKMQQQSGQTFFPIPSTNNSDNSSTNSDQSTNAPDQSTPTNSPDQSTNSAPMTPASPDQSTNSTSDSSTNIPPPVNAPPTNQ